MEYRLKSVISEGVKCFRLLVCMFLILSRFYGNLVLGEVVFIFEGKIEN